MQSVYFTAPAKWAKDAVKKVSSLISVTLKRAVTKTNEEVPYFDFAGPRGSSRYVPKIHSQQSETDHNSVKGYDDMAIRWDLWIGRRIGE